jgi:predicted ATPase
MHLPSLPALQEYEAVRLFVEHAARAHPGFELTLHNLVAVTQICARLDGIPLAIEMAAARVRAMSVGEIAARLDQHYQWLTSGRRTALPRHQTLRATLDWSYDLLSPAEQVLLTRLAVFAGGWTVELAEVVAADADDLPSTRRAEGNVLPPLRTSDILPLLLQLAEKSVVIPDAEPRAGVTRYHMLETVRQYVAEKLSELGEMDRRFERLADYVMSQLTRGTGSIRGRRDAEIAVWAKQLDAELDNLRALMAWARTRTDGTMSLRLAAALADHWGAAQGHMAETQVWVEGALAQHAPAPAGLRAKALNGLLRMIQYRGYNLARWEALAEESLALSAQADDPYERYESLCYAYWVQFGQWMKLALWTRPLQWDTNPHLPRMETLAEEMLALARRLEYAHGIVVGLRFYGDVQSLRGDSAMALSHYEASLRLAQETGNVTMAQAVMSFIAQLDSVRALEACEQEVARQRVLGERESLALALRTLGLFSAGQGDFVRAHNLLQESLALRHKLGVPWNTIGSIGSLHYDLGRVALLQDNDAEALVQLQQAFDIFQKAGR